MSVVLIKEFMAVPTLKYLQIKDSIDRLVARMKPGDKLPSERQLARKHNCNLLTLRKAMKLVQDEGKLVRRRGSGTFVRERPDAGGSGSWLIFGVILPEKVDAFGVNLVHAIAAEAATRNIHLVFYTVNINAGENIAEAIAHLRKQGCAALLMPCAPDFRFADIIFNASQRKLPVATAVLFPGLEKYCFELPTLFGKSVFSTTEKQVRYFRAMEREDIALLVPELSQSPIVSQRVSAYLSAIQKHGLRQLCLMVGPTTDDMDRIASGLREFRGKLAVTSYDDTHALRLMTAMRKLGLVAPDDYLIMGQNDIEPAVYADPPLSTLSAEYDYIAHWMIRHAIALVQGSSDQSNREAEPAFVIRDSCGGRRLLGDKLPGVLAENHITTATDGRVADLSVA